MYTRPPRPDSPHHEEEQYQEEQDSASVIVRDLGAFTRNCTDDTTVENPQPSPGRAEVHSSIVTRNNS